MCVQKLSHVAAAVGASDDQSKIPGIIRCLGDNSNSMCKCISLDGDDNSDLVDCLGGCRSQALVLMCRQVKPPDLL
jgi:hypothetical protein